MLNIIFLHFQSSQILTSYWYRATRSVLHTTYFSHKYLHRDGLPGHLKGINMIHVQKSQPYCIQLNIMYLTSIPAPHVPTSPASSPSDTLGSAQSERPVPWYLPPQNPRGWFWLSARPLTTPHPADELVLSYRNGPGHMWLCWLMSKRPQNQWGWA